MKNMTAIKKGLNILGLLFITMTLSAQTFSERERIEKTFKVNPETTIEVNNKYGKIHIIPWRKDSVKYEIELNISSNSLSRVQKIRSGIKFDFTSSRHYVTAITDFGSTGNQIFTELRNLSDALITGKNTIEVNYRIYCPETVNLSIINKFGDIYIDDLNGEINISLSNGDMRINSINGVAQIEQSFGNAILNHLTDAKLSISYSDIKIKAAEKLIVNSKSSTLNIDEADLLKLDSRRDKYFITRIHTIQGSSDFSQIWIEDFQCNANLALKYGEFSIDKIRQDFCGMDIVSDYTDLNLYLEKGAGYYADLYYHEDVYLTLPDGISDLNLTTIDRSEEEKHSYFKMGNGPDLPQIKIQALEKCYLNMIVK